MKKATLVIPTWSGKTNESYWGSNDYASIASCFSTWISLRTVRPKDAYTTDFDKAIQDLAVYVWFDADQCISIDIRARDIYSATEHQLELTLKTLKALRKKVAKTFSIDNFTRNSDIHTQLTLFFVALGVTESVVYNPSRLGRADDVYEPIAISLKTIAETLEKRKPKQVLFD